jgi:hypothetical protein
MGFRWRTAPFGKPSGQRKHGNPSLETGLDGTTNAAMQTEPL